MNAEIKKQMTALKTNKGLFITSVMLLAVIANLGLTFYMHHNSAVPEKTGLWSTVAEHLHHHGVYSIGTTDAQGKLIPTAAIPPLYTYICYIIFSIFGVTQKSFIFLGALLMLMNIGIVFTTYRIGELFGYRTGCIAALVAVLDLNLIFLATNPAIPDTMLVLLLALSYLYLLKFLKTRQTYKDIAAGSFFLGLALLTKTVAYPLWFPISAFLTMFMLKKGVSFKQTSRQIGIFLLIQALFIGGWQLRNYHATGKAWFHSIQGDILLSQASFIKAYQEGITFSEAKTSFFSKRGVMSEKEWDQYSTETARKMVLGSPFDFAVVMLQGVPKLLMGSVPPLFLYGRDKAKTPVPRFQEGVSHLPVLKEFWAKGYFGYVFLWGYIKLHLLGIYLMSCCSMALLFRSETDRWPLLFLLLIIAYFILVSVPAGEFRYRYTMMPIFYFLSAYAWDFTFRKWGNARELLR